MENQKKTINIPPPPADEAPTYVHIAYYNQYGEAIVAQDGFQPVASDDPIYAELEAIKQRHKCKRPDY